MVLVHALQALQQVVHLVLDLRELPLDGLQIARLHCEGGGGEAASFTAAAARTDNTGTRTGAGRPLTRLGGRGEAGLGPSAAPTAHADPRALGGDGGAGQRGRRGRGHAGLVGVHPERRVPRRMSGVIEELQTRFDTSMRV